MVRAFQISAQSTAYICLIWDWGWTWSGLYLAGSPIGISLINPSAPTGQQAGSTYILDSLFDGTATAIKANFEQASILETSIITLDNIGVLNVNTMVAYTDGDNLDLPAADVDFVVIGNLEADGSAYGQYNVAVQLPAPSLLGPTSSYYRDSYFVQSRPQYTDIAVGSIISVKAHGAVGNGVHDDTAAIVSALALATTSNLIYFPAGSYIVTSTIVVPPNTRMTGEVWSQLVASGPYFADMTNPKPMIQVGNVGDVGTVEISDMLFTSIGALPGLILVEWNIQAETQGSVGIWDAHFRLGGAYGTDLQVAQCPSSEPIQSGCIAASMMLHITPSSNGYFENMWAWVADHDIDDPANTQITVIAARGILIESDTGPTWLYGTASEHSILYQYNFANTTNTFAGMIQTESPYYQYTTATESPGPFNSSIGLFANDPAFPDSTCDASALLCDFSWAVMLAENVNLTIAGAGLYSWFNNYIETCVDSQNCQQRLINDAGDNEALYLWNLVTIGAVEMVSNTYTGNVVLAKNNTQAIGHPYWSALAGYLDDYEPEIFSCAWNETGPGCDETLLCDLTLTFETFAELQAAQGTFLDQCTDYYAINTLYTVLNATMANYTIAEQGYSGLFGDYVKYQKEMLQPLLAQFMGDSTPSDINGGPGNQYFECSITGYGAPSTQPCPFTYKQLQGATSFVMTYTLINSTGFYDDLQTNYAINSSWITFGDTGGEKTYGGCAKGQTCIVTDKRYHNIPLTVPSSDITIPNPQLVIQKALPNIQTLQNTLLARQLDVNLGTWNGSNDDLLQVLSMPVFMINQAVNAMATVKQIGENAAREEKIALVLEVLGFVFAFLPLVDEVLPELEFLDGMVELITTVGNTALTIDDIINNPTSAPMAILGLIAGPGARNEENYAAIAATRRAMTEDELTAVGKDFEEDDSEFQGIIAPRCRT